MPPCATVTVTRARVGVIAQEYHGVRAFRVPDFRVPDTFFRVPNRRTREGVVWVLSSPGLARRIWPLNFGPVEERSQKEKENYYYLLKFWGGAFWNSGDMYCA
jgi:hypothetical protein